MDNLRQNAQDYEELQQRIAGDMESITKEFGLTRKQVETIWADRLDLINLYIDKLYSLAKDFALSNREMSKNRGLFLLLVDRRNMDAGNFSEFYDSQIEQFTQRKCETQCCNLCFST